MPTTPTAEVTSRATLKTLFTDGARPSGADFGALIDSFVHRGDAEGGNSPGTNAPGRDSGALQIGNRSFSIETGAAGLATLSEAQRALLTLSEDGQWRVPAANATVPLAIDGWLASAARVGAYSPTAIPAKPAFPGGDVVAPGKAPADGKWQVVLPALNGCCAFEIVAHASGAAALGRHAMLYAVVLTSFNGSRKGLRITRTQRGWGWLRRLELRWRPRRTGWFGRPNGYDLVIRTRFSYGMDDSGQPVQIRFHITRLW